MRLLVLSHQADAGPGVFADVAKPFEEACLAAGAPPRPAIGDYDAAIVLGGDANVDQEAEHPWLRDEKALIGELLERRTPMLGVCLGAQLIADVAGAAVGPLAGGTQEIGWHDVASSAGADPVLGDAPPTFTAFEWHGYGFAVPQGATELARNGAGAQAFRLGEAWAIQFHAEVTEATVAGWIADYGAAAGIDAHALTAETGRRIGHWNGFGRGLCARFLAHAAARTKR